MSNNEKPIIIGAHQNGTPQVLTDLPRSSNQKLAGVIETKPKPAESNEVPGTDGPRKKPTLNLELRSEEIQDILTKPPSWMIRSGNSVLICLVLLAFLLSYFIKYPDMIEGNAVISTQTPAIYTQSAISGRIGRVLTENGVLVEKGQLIAEIENPVSSSSIQFLSAFLDHAEDFMQGTANLIVNEPESINLYSASADYNDLKKSLAAYASFLSNKARPIKISDLESRLKNQGKLRDITLKEIEFNKAGIDYAKEKFSMQEKEYKLGYVSKLDFLNAKTAYNQALKTEESIKKNVVQMDMTIAGLRSQINEFRQGLVEQKEQQEDEIYKLISSLKNYTIKWSSDHALKAPISGRLEFMGRIKEHQLINAGDPLYAIVPTGNRYEVEVSIPFAGFGKVEVGHEVKLKLDNFPYNEYGIVNAKVVGLPALPGEKGYKVLVDLTDGLKTSYGIQVKYSPEMTASAEVITEDLRLIERFFYQILSLIK